MAASEVSETFQIPLDIAELYEAAMVPAFFAQWAPLLCDAAGIVPGQRVLDVACGTGIVARTAADRVGADGVVVGVDLNEAMLTVARRVLPGIEFRRADAAALPFEDDSFDVALSQMALMFFPDRVESIREMARVTSAGGTVAVLVPATLEQQDCFAPFVTMAVQHAGTEAAALLGAYFACGDLGGLVALVEASGLEVTAATVEVGTYRAPSVDAFVTTEVESTPLVQRISAEAYARIRADAHDVLAPYSTPDGVIAPFRSNLVVARRP